MPETPPAQGAAELCERGLLRRVRPPGSILLLVLIPVVVQSGVEAREDERGEGGRCTHNGGSSVARGEAGVLVATALGMQKAICGHG